MSQRTVQVHSQGHEYGRCSSFWAAAVNLGLIRAVRLCPLTVIADDLQAFADGLDRDTITKVNRFMRSKRPRKGNPALPVSRKGGRPAGTGLARHLGESRETVPRAGGTRPVDPSGGTA